MKSRHPFSDVVYPVTPFEGIGAQRSPRYGPRDAVDADIALGSTVLDTNGETIGTIAEVYLDNQTGQSDWATVSIGRHRCLVPLTDARVTRNTVWVPVTAEQVRSAPRLDPATALTVDDKYDLDRHFGITDQERGRSRKAIALMDDPDRLANHCTRRADSTASGRDDPSGAERARMLARWRRQATVLTISGDIDAANGDRVQAFATGFIQAGNALALDLSGVDFFGAQGISVLIAIDDACRAAEVRWALVPSRNVSRVLQLTGCDTTLPTASSVPEALRQVTALSQARHAVLQP